MKKLFAIAIAAVPFVLIYFLSAAEYRFYSPEESMLKVAFKHSGKRIEECDEERFLQHQAERYRRENRKSQGVRMDIGLLEKTGCSRERHPIRLRIVVDGRLLLDKTYQPVGIRKDGASFIYEKFTLPSGKHSIEITMKDSKDSPPYLLKSTVEFPPERVLLVRFDPKLNRLVIE